MIGYLRGHVLDFEEGKLLIGMGHSNHSDLVGYLVSIPHGARYSSYKIGTSVELLIYTHVREDLLELYGFASLAEKTLFLSLLRVSGIGPKSALNILSQMDPGRFIGAILSEDSAELTQISGLGKKTAERVVIELKDFIQKKCETGHFQTLLSSVDPLPQGSGPLHVKHSIDSSIFSDAKIALVGLGYREPEALDLLKKTLLHLQEPPKKVEDLIRSALRQLTQ